MCLFRKRNPFEKNSKKYIEDIRILQAQIKEITDKEIPNKDYAQLAYMVLSMVALAVIEISITFLHARLMGKAGHTVISKIRQVLQ